MKNESAKNFKARKLLSEVLVVASSIEGAIEEADEGSV